MSANEIRGEVDVEFEGQTYVLRPSYEAIVAFEKAIGTGLIQLAMLADSSALSLEHTALIVTHCINAWGRDTGNPDARGANPGRIGRLILGVGLVGVLPRVAMVLSLAATGGCNPDGTRKGEATTTGTTTEIPAVD